MNILSLDTCFNACSAAVGQDIGDRAQTITGLCEHMQRGHAERLAQMISEVMGTAQFDFTGLDRIAVTTGPGSFTGSRVGVATARALAMAADLPLIGVSSLAVMAMSPLIDDDKDGEEGVSDTIDQLAVIVDARRDQVYAQLFSRDDKQPKTPPLLLSIRDAALIGGSGPILLVGSGAELVSNATLDAGRQTVVKATSIQPDICDYVCAASMLPATCDAVNPLYMRPPDAKPQTGKSIARA